MRNLILALIVIVCFASYTNAEETRSIAQASASVPTVETPKKFEKLLGKWSYSDKPKYTSTFELIAVTPSGEGIIKDYKVGGRDVPQAMYVVTENGQSIGVRIQLGEGYWDLTYYDRSGGMLFGTFNPVGRHPDNGTFYRE